MRHHRRQSIWLPGPCARPKPDTRQESIDAIWWHGYDAGKADPEEQMRNMLAVLEALNNDE